MDRDVALQILTAVTTIKTATQALATNSAPSNRVPPADQRSVQADDQRSDLEEEPEPVTKEKK